MTYRPRPKKVLRYFRNTLLVLLTLILIGAVVFVLEVRIPDPLNKDEEAIVPQRHLDAEGRWHVGNDWLGRDSLGLYETYIEGGDLERGLAYGSLARELIEKQERIFTDRIHALIPGSAKLEVLKYFVAWFDRNLADNVPREYLREIYGVSRSFSDQYDPIGPKFHRALNYHAAHDIGHALQDLALVGCTSFATWGDHTADGGGLVARNFDFYLGEDFARDKLITFIAPTGGIPHVLISWGGFMGATSAMNLDGLTVTINASRSEIPFSARMPISLLARTIVEHASTIDEAVAIARKHEVFVSESILVYSAKDKRAVIIEKAPDGMGVFTPPGNLAVCANHYQSDRFKDTEVNLANIRESDSEARYERMNALVDTATALDPATAVRILRDMKGPHGEDVGMGNPMTINQMIAHHSVVFQPDKRLMWVSTWPYQMGAFVCYDLNKVFARCKAGDVHGPIYEPGLTIPASSFAGSPEMAQHTYYSKTRNAIYEHIISGIPFSLTKQQEEDFIRSNPECFLTYSTLGDLRKAQDRYALAIPFYRSALEKEVSSVAEREHIQHSLDECAKH